MKRWVLIIAFLCLGSTAVNADNGHKNYLLHCRGCHTPTGAAIPAINMPSLHELGPLLGSDEGRQYIVQIPGVAHTPLDDEEVAEVLNWIVKNFNAEAFTSGFKLFTASEVAQARGNIEADPRKRRDQIQGGS